MGQRLSQGCALLPSNNLLRGLSCPENWDRKSLSEGQQPSWEH